MNTRAWFEDIKEDIVNRLEELEGTEHYTTDLGFTLTETENANGSWYCSAWKAEQEVAEHFRQYGAIAEYMRDNWEDKTNPLLETELFHCKAMICLYEQAFAYAACDLPDYGELQTIDADFISAIKEALQPVRFDDLF